MSPSAWRKFKFSLQQSQTQLYQNNICHSTLLSRWPPHSTVLVRCTAHMAIMNNLPVPMVSQCCNPQLSLDSGLQKQSYVSFWVPQQDRLLSPGSALQFLPMHSDPEPGRTHVVSTKIKHCNLQAPIY